MKSNVELGRGAHGRGRLAVAAPLALLFVLALPAVAVAQWTTSGNNATITTPSNVSIGTTTADRPFTVQGQVPTIGGAMTIIRTTGSNHGSGLALDAAGTGNNNLGFLVSGTRKAAISWDNSRSFLGLLNTTYSDNDFSLRLLNNGSLTFNDGADGTERVRFTVAGNVGIGTASPSTKLHIGGQADNLFQVVSTGTGATDTVANFVSGAGNIMIVRANGNVGIGTTSPSQIFQVHGSGTFSGMRVTTTATGATINDGVNFGYDDSAAYGAYVWNREASAVLFATSNTERMRVDAAGNVGIGTNTPAAKLDVNGNVNVTGNVTATGNISAKYQDLAEWVPSTQKLAAGTVVVLDTRNSNHVLASTTAYDTRVAGVISARPGISLGEAGEGKMLVATTGRVKVKVDASRAPIQIGDLIVTSDVEGVAMKSEPVLLGGRQMHAPGTIIGKALEPLEKGTGEILVLLSLQ